MNYIIFIIVYLLNILNSQECLGGELRTIESYLYGGFEVNMKSAEGNGYVSSFFTYHDFWDEEYDNWESLVNEIDIEFTGNLNNSVQFTSHHPGPWSLTQIIDVNYNPHEEFHNYALEWTPYNIKWFVDGIELYSQSQDIVDDLTYPQKIMMNLWSAVWIDWVGEWDNATMPVNSYYDFVKYYEYTPGDGFYGSNNDFTLSWIDNFDNFDSAKWEEATHSFNSNYCQFDPINVIYHNGQMILIVSDTDYLLGDVNQDMVLDIVDIVRIVNMILSLEDIINVADYNQDNLINIVDLIIIIIQILG